MIVRDMSVLPERGLDAFRTRDGLHAQAELSVREQPLVRSRTAHGFASPYSPAQFHAARTFMKIDRMVMRFLWAFGLRACRRHDGRTGRCITPASARDRRLVAGEAPECLHAGVRTYTEAQQPTDYFGRGGRGLSSST